MNAMQARRDHHMIRCYEHDRVAEITLDRPTAANALDRAGVRELRAALASLSEAVELIVIRGAGGRAFCGGADSREMVSLSAQERKQAILELGECVTELWRHPALTLAALDGYATGGGAHLALACDLRTASESAWMQFPSRSYGLNIGCVWLSLLAGPAAAAHLLASSRRLSAEEAERLGIVQAVVPGDTARERLGLSDPTELRELKATIRLALPANLESALRAEHERAAEMVTRELFVTSLSSSASVRPR